MLLAANAHDTQHPFTKPAGTPPGDIIFTGQPGVVWAACGDDLCAVRGGRSAIDRTFRAAGGTMVRSIAAGRSGSLAAPLTQSGSGIANTGNLTLAAAVTYSEIITGPIPPAFGNVHVIGGVNLGGSTLSLSGSGAGRLQLHD